jgi:hypothetical protein
MYNIFSISNMKFLLIMILPFFLFSCFNKTQNSNINLKEQKIEWNLNTSSTSSLMEKSIKENTILLKNNTWILDKPSIEEEKIKFKKITSDISNLDELLKIAPTLKSDPKINDPKFIELQKNIILLWLEKSNIKDKDYMNIQKKYWILI